MKGSPTDVKSAKTYSERDVPTADRTYINAAIPLDWPPGTYAVALMFHDRVQNQHAGAVIPVSIQP